MSGKTSQVLKFVRQVNHKDSRSLQFSSLMMHTAYFTTMSVLFIGGYKGGTGARAPVRLQILSFSCSSRQKMCKTGMHSSRVRTIRFSGHLFCTYSPCHTWCHSSLQCGQTDACENTTLPQTSIAGGNKRLEQPLRELTPHPPQENPGSATDCLRKTRLQLELVCDGMNIAH